MKIEGSGLEGLTLDLSRLNEIMEENGFVLAGQWDYERVTFDHKIETKGEIFYLRVQGYAIEGDVGGRHAVIKLISPLLGKHYYPHGVEYGEGENFPSTVVNTSKSLLKQVSEAIHQVI
jgi:YugN-like family